MADASIELFVDDADGVEGVGMILHEASIVEDAGGVLVPGVKLSPEEARRLMNGLMACIADIEGPPRPANDAQETKD